MASKLKEYQMSVQFNAYSFTVKARTKGEARKKIYGKLRRKDIVKLIDKPNTYLDKY